MNANEKDPQRRPSFLVPKDQNGKNNKKKAKKQNLEDLKKEIVMQDHKMNIDELYRLYQTDPVNGLTNAKHKELLEKNGPNKLTPPKQTPEWVKLLAQMKNGFAILLWIGCGFSIIAFIINTVQEPLTTPKDDLWLAIVLAVVVVATGIFQYYQESRSGKIMESFNKMLPQQAIVVREGKKENIPAEQLVVGDIVHLEIGNRVPADVRLINNNGLKVDNSSLTGESEPQSRSIECTHDNPLETKNLAFFSTFAVEGRALGVVIRTGDSTAMGRIARLTANLSVTDTHLAQELNHFVHIVTVAAFSFGIIFFLISIGSGYSFIYSFVLLIGVVVAVVPESLRACLTVSLTLTAKRMAKKNCLVKNLEAIEALGSIGIICSDKTGTLTMNRMTVGHMWMDDSVVSIDLNKPKDSVHSYEILTEEENTAQKGRKSLSRGPKYDIESSTGWSNLARCACLCNRAEFKSDPENMAKDVLKRLCVGDGSETAILQYSELFTKNGVMSYRKEFEKVFEVPFNSTNKFQFSVHKMPNDSKNRLLVMKGAPERILDYCSTILIKGKDELLTDEWKASFNIAYETLGGMGERVLGFCDLLLDSEEYPEDYVFDADNITVFPPRKLRFLGFISMIDPPKPNVIEAIAKCHTAGIKVFMVTGDHPITAKAIAKAVGIIKGETKEDKAKRLGIPVAQVDLSDIKSIVINGGQLMQMSKAEFKDVLKNHEEIVFARTSPQQKLLIVEACQETGVLVGVTGDGVNDSPAMRKADIGISMGITGSEVSKQVADMVLLDDNFATIVSGIEEGRLIFDNISKIIQYSFTKNIAQLSPLILSIITSVPLAITAITVLCVDLGTDVLPSVSLSYEKAEKGIMKRKPRDPVKDKMTNSKLVSLCYGQIGLIEAAGGIFCYMVSMAESGWWPSRLLGVRMYWDSTNINDLKDSYGAEWTYSQRLTMLNAGHTTFYVAIVICQLFNAFFCKTKRVSVFQHGIKNMVLNVVVFGNIALACFLIYVPGLNSGLGFQPIIFLQWLPPLAFAVYLFSYGEIIKLIARKFPNSFFAKNLIV